MPTGEALSSSQVEEISRISDRAEADSGLHFSVFVGPFDGDARSYAGRLHAALGPVAARTVLIAVSPPQRRLEIVTGHESARRVNDRACALAAMSMRAAFSSGDVAGGLLNGLRMLADAAGAEV